jgi:hypothetical protein
LVALLPDLKSPKIYRAVLEGLAKKWAKRGRLDRLAIGELTLVELRSRAEELSRLLAKVVSHGEYELSPLVPRRGRFEGKNRVIYRPNLLDAVVLTVLARYLSAASEAELAPTLHSYRAGHSTWLALEQLADFLGVYRAAVTVRERGLFVMRRDVAKYGDSIPTDDGSPLVLAVDRVLARDVDERRRATIGALVHAALVHPVRWDDGSVAPLLRGIPTGSPIQPPLLNLYLSPVDVELSSVPGGFYSRFGDDVLFLHPDPEEVLRVSRRFDSALAERGLVSNATKRQDLYFNGAGRPPTTVSGFRPTQSLEYLGAQVSFSGRLGLKCEHFQRLLRALRERLLNQARLCIGLGREERLRFLCIATRRALDPKDALALPNADRLHSALNDRSQMRDFDYRVASCIAEVIDGRRGVRAFRTVPIELQRSFGAYSVEAERRRIAQSKQTHLAADELQVSAKSKRSIKGTR